MTRKSTTPARRHKASKHAILAAGFLLRLTLCGNIGKSRRKPSYKPTESKIRKLQEHVENARELQNLATDGGIPHHLKAEREQMRKLKMIRPNQYIKATEDRIELLSDELQKQKGTRS